ncbi:hypothetical protein ACFWUP_20760 [Nocardia sp. NPDC058658]|uniref:hypothetical protein n=1 Tax=Nocardia sp. NPDC058658 TaxID=3346580 RepID=UPI00366693D5
MSAKNWVADTRTGMTIKLAYEITINEPLDLARLTLLRKTLGLRACGRMDDDWDYKFGYKDLKGDGIQAVELTLWRADDAPWHLTVSYSTDNIPTSEELAWWQARIITGVEAAGLSATIRN